MSALAQADTWGVAGPTFLRWYIVAAVVALMVAAVVAVAVPRWVGVESTSERGGIARPRPLTPPEVGALTSDYQAIMASLSILRAAGVLRPGGSRARELTVDERTRIDWFTRTVLERIGSGSRRPSKASLVGSLTVATAQLRSPLVEMGYLTGDRARRAGRLPAACLLVVAAVGIVRVVAGLTSGKPVLYLIGVVLLLLFAALLARRVPRRTGLGSAELRRLTTEFSYLAPHMRPSFTAYGPSSAGMSAALFGGAALLWLDPQMAAAMSAGSSSGGWAGSSTDSSSAGSSSSDSGSGSSGSSCGGGGGCGG